MEPQTLLDVLVHALHDAEDVLRRLKAIKETTGGTRELGLAITNQEDANWRLSNACNEAARTVGAQGLPPLHLVTREAVQTPEAGTNPRPPQ